MHKIKRIAIFHTEFIYSGGAEKMIFNQVKYLKQLGYIVNVYSCFVDKNNSYPDVIDNYNIFQILPNFLNNIFGNKIMIFLTLLAFPFWFYRFRDFDIFIGENQVGPWLAFLAAKFNNKKYFTYQPYPTTFTSPRKVDKNIYFLKFLSIFDKYIIRNASKSFANGLYAKDVLTKVYNREFINCPAGVERQAFNKKIFNERFKNKYILITNRNVPKKHLEWSDKIIPKNTQLITVGQGTETGYVSEIELEKLYKYACVYVYTAPEEDFGMGIIEAMSFGVPVVAWNYAGPSRIIENNMTGFLAKPYAFRNFNELLIKLIENRNLNYKMSVAAYEESKKYSWKKHVKQMEKFFLLQ